MIDKDNKSVGHNGAQKAFDGENEFKITGWGYRHQQSIILFFTLTIAYSMRACMGVALVAMTEHHVDAAAESAGNYSLFIKDKTINYRSHEGMNGYLIKDFKVSGFFNALMLTPPYPTFEWSKKVQDAVISSFFWGYMLLQIPAGQLAHRFGARYLLIGAMLINSVVSILMPLVTYYGGWICTALCRVLQGLSQACIVPGIHTFFGKWAPLKERGRLTAITYGGAVLGLPITGFISSSSFGWPGIFRFYGVLSGLIGGVLWWLAADTPAKHPKISAAERQYIEDELGQKAGHDQKQLPVPWSRILRSSGVYAIIVAHTANAWGQLILYSEVPAFMDAIMGVNIKANGLLSALPFLVMWFTNFFFSWFTDMLIVKNILSVTSTRKFATTLGYLPAAIGLVALAYVPKNIYAVEAILICICAFKISAHSGFQINHIDISPNFAGTLMSLSNFVSNLIASLAPIVAGFILTDVKSEHLWGQIFFVSAGLYVFSNIFYVTFGTGKKADWNEPIDDNKDEIESHPMLENPRNI